MAIEDVFSITGRGTVATGKIDRGIVKVGETVEFSWVWVIHKSTTVTGVEMFQKTLDEGVAGDNVGILLRWFTREGEIERGMVLARTRNNYSPYNTFESELYILTKEEGGRQYSILSQVIDLNFMYEQQM